MKNKIKIFFIIISTSLFLSLFLRGEAINVSHSSYMSTNAKVAIDQGSEIMVVWEEHIGTASYIYYSVCMNNTCSTPLKIPEQNGNQNILPDVYKGRTAGFVVVWHEQSGCNCIKFTSFNGKNWSTPIRVSQVGGYEMGKPKIATTSKRICVVWDVGNPLFSDAFVNVWDSGWSGVKQISITGYHHAAKVADVNVGPDGKFYVAWEEIRDKSETEDMLEIVFTQDNGHNSWTRPIDLTDFQETCFRPTIAVNNQEVLVTYFRRRAYWSITRSSSGWSSHTYIGNGGHEHELYYSDSASIGNGFIFVWRDLGYNIRYAIRNNGKWSEPYLVASGDTYHPAVDFKDSVGATIVWTDREKNDVLLSIIDVEGEPEPEPDPNKPPVAKFTFSPKTGLYPLKVHFDASGSYDEDGKIVKYAWSFGDNTTGTGKQIDHTYNKKGIYYIRLQVTDDDGATANTFGTVEVLGIYSPLNQHYELKENRSLFYKEYLYKITWDINPKNAEIGATIVNYKIYRKKKGTNEYHYLAIVSANKFEYYDRSLGSNNIAYEYAITAIDKEGRESSVEN